MGSESLRTWTVITLNDRTGEVKFYTRRAKEGLDAGAFIAKTISEHQADDAEYIQIVCVVPGAVDPVQISEAGKSVYVEDLSALAGGK